MMKNKTMFLVAAALVAGLALTSCKKADTPDPPAGFDPQIDGIAVRPLPPLDYVAAQDILRRQRAAASARAARETPAPAESTPETTPTPEAQPQAATETPPASPNELPPGALPPAGEIGRASCRERVYSIV
jgi:hypothetical protein